MLHLVKHSPLEKNTLAFCLERAAPGQTILLIENGVYGAKSGSLIEPQMIVGLQELTICALGPDLDARGILELEMLKGIRRVDYEEFVALAADSERIHSWF